MENENQDMTAFDTPKKPEIEKSCSFNESFQEVKDKSAFFQNSAKLLDIENRESMGFGKESLGILPMNVIEQNLIESNTISPKGVLNLNRAFLFSNSHSISFSVNSSEDSLKTPNQHGVCSFDYAELFSPIENEKSKSNRPLSVCLNLPACLKAKNYKTRGRTQSLSTIMEINREERKIREEENSHFNQSLLMEARVLASKIADNSIYDGNGEICNLDDVPQPEFLNDCNECEKSETVPSSKDLLEMAKEVVQKAEKTLNFESDNKENSSDKQHESPPQCDNLSVSGNVSFNAMKHSETILNLSKIFHNQNKSALSTSRASCLSNKSNSKDAKEILGNLSDLLSSENLTVEQISEGQNLLYDLANILYNSRTSSHKESSDDSGHSSIENVDQEANSTRSKPVQQKVEAIESTEKPPDRGSNRSLSYPQTSKKADNIPGGLNNCRLNVPGAFSKLSKLKPKRVENKKKGPLKAVLPLGTMSKGFNRQNKIASTPPKSEGPSFGNKRTSTPKRDLQLCPMAQSTPDCVPNKETTIRRQSPQSNLPKPSVNCPISPLATPGKSKETSVKNMQRTLTDSSLSKLKDSPLTAAMNRRKSSGDVKLQTSASGLKRSNSMSKETKPLSSNNKSNNSADKCQSSGLKRSNSMSKETKALSSNNMSNNSADKCQSSGLKRSNSMSKETKPLSSDNKSNNNVDKAQKNLVKNTGIKSFSLMSKFRKSAGKENLSQ